MAATDDGLLITLPPDFRERCAKTNQRIEAGEAMTLEYIAAELGLSFEFFAACVAMTIAMKGGVPVIDLSKIEKPH